MSEGRWRRFELVAVALTALVFVALPKPPAADLPVAVFVPLCLLGWTSYLALRLRADPTLAGRWGLDPTHELGPLLARLAPPFVAAVGVGIAVALARGAPLVPRWLWLSLLLYPLWGLVQQWLVQALFVDNVKALTNAPLGVLVLLGAIGFGAIHLAHPSLVVATGLLGAAYVVAFQRHRNLWPLGVAHGWLGSLFYPWVLDLNPTERLLDTVIGAIAR